MPSSSLILTLAVVVLHTTFSSAIPVDNSENAYSGMGGHASGGNVTTTHEKSGLLGGLFGGLTLLNYKSGNGGDGGDARSGNAIGGFGSMLSPKFGRWTSSNSGNAYTQDGGVADGGSVEGPDGLINLNSNNGGSAGHASSGTAIGGVGGGGDGQEDRHDDGREDDRQNDEDDRDGQDDEHHHDGDNDDCNC